MSEIKFDAAAAEKLVWEMEAYCQSMSTEGRELFALLDEAADWNDQQSQAFTENITEICRILIEALGQLDEYRAIYSQRIAELRG